VERRKFIQGVIGLAAAAAAKVALGDDFKVAELKVADEPKPVTVLDGEPAEGSELTYEAYLRSKSTANPNSGRCTQCEGPLDDTRRSKATRICAPCLGALSKISGNSSWFSGRSRRHTATAKDWGQVTKRA